jgi:uncharacterized protein (TIGR03083 family)
VTVDLTPMLRPERATLLEFLQGLSPEDWAKPTECPAWDVKGVALHILGDDLSLLSRQRDAATDGLTLFARERPGQTFRQLLDGFNEQWVTAAEFFGAGVLVDMLRDVGDLSAGFYEDVGLETMAREPVQFFADLQPSPYWKVIAREYAERVIHQSQMRRAVGAPELDGEIVTAAALVHAHMLAAWLRDYPAPHGATIVVEFGDAGVWTWKRQPDRWEALDGAGDAPDARVCVAPAYTVRLLTRAVDAGDLASILTIVGHEDLARGALEVVRPFVVRPGT